MRKLKAVPKVQKFTCEGDVFSAVRVTHDEWHLLGIPMDVCTAVGYYHSNGTSEDRVLLGDWIIWEDCSDGSCGKISDRELRSKYRPAPDDATPSPQQAERARLRRQEMERLDDEPEDDGLFNHEPAGLAGRGKVQKFVGEWGHVVFAVQITSDDWMGLGVPAEFCAIIRSNPHERVRPGDWIVWAGELWWTVSDTEFRSTYSPAADNRKVTPIFLKDMTGDWDVGFRGDE